MEGIKKLKTKFLEIYKKVVEKICIHPESVETKFSNWFDNKKKIAFFTTLIIGILAHITFITEMILSQDGVWNSLSYLKPGGWEIVLGRWGIVIAGFIVNYLAIPNITGVVCVVIIAMSSVLLVDVLKLKSKLGVFIASAAMAVAPTLAGTMIYAYTSVAYCVAMLVSIFIVWLLFNGNKIINTIIATVLFIFSLAIYQSYIGVTVGLAVIRLIKDLFDEDYKIKDFFIAALRIGIVVIIGGLLYAGITNIIFEQNDLSGATYKGMENISIMNTLKNLKVSISRSYKDFVDFYFGDSIIFNTVYSRDVVYKVLFTTVILLEIILIISNKMWKKPVHMLFVLALNIVLPVAFNVILLLATDTITYILTAAQMILVIPFAVMICEMSNGKFTWIFRWITIGSLLVIVMTYYLATNASYTTLKLTYDQTYATVLRMIDRIEQTEGYRPEQRIMINGIVEAGKDYRYFRTNNIREYSFATLFRDCPVFHGTYSGMNGTWEKYLNNYMGMKINFCRVEEYVEIVNTEEYKALNVFPEDNSIKIINDIIVVKMRENAIMP